MPSAIDGFKECTRCRAVKPVSEFRYRKAAKDKLNSRCTECLNFLAKQDRDANPGKKSRARKASRLKNIEKNSGKNNSAYSDANLSSLKRCTICLVEKPRQLFGRERGRADGFVSYCRECAAGIKSLYYYKDHELTKKKAREAYERNPEQYREYQRDWYHNNRDVCLEKQREYRRNNPGKFNEYVATRKAMKRRATPKWVDRKALQKIYEQASTTTKETGVLHTADHIVPLVSKVVCGLHVPWNLRVIPFKENCSKGNKFSNEMLEQILSGLDTD